MNNKITITAGAKYYKAVVTSIAIMGSAISVAHSETLGQQLDPQLNVINQYERLKNTDARSAELHQLVATLNQRLDSNPSDSLAWELLAQIYYNNGYYAYAVYAASEAIDQGYRSDKLQKILLNSSAIVSQNQLQQDYLTDELDDRFLNEYQSALSRIYGSVYGFNYDESLPKPPAPVVKPKAVKAKVKVPRRATKKKAQIVSKKKAAPKKKTVVKTKPRVVPKKAPVKKIVKPAPKKSNPRSTDPFSILR
ncbi:hypothetical protein [Psychrobacter sp. DM8]|uniref:hypothetical protein n=1 Tax=Psychrobacter sp. DM8 TaxID=3440636 RepID=UPI003F500D8D